MAVLALSTSALAGGLAGASEKPVKRCGYVDGSVAVVAHRVACAEAKNVTRAYLNGKGNPFGFHCRRYKVNAAAGWQAKCTRRHAYVQIIPE